jgi:hypothetical protein
MKRLNVRLRTGAAMHVTRVPLNSAKLVYVIVASKKLRYRWGRSPIVYIGTTRKGTGRMAQSAARLTDKVLSKHGVKSFDVRMLTCRPRNRVKTWIELERALLHAFRKMYGDVPEFNSQGKRARDTNAFRYFRENRLREILQQIKDGD